MALNIKNEQTEAAIRALAERTGESLTAAVHQAVLDKLTGLERDDDRATRIERATRISDELARGLGRYGAGMTTDDLYDPETGLPA